MRSIIILCYVLVWVQGGALTPMELAPGLPFAAGMIDSP